jgi:hypothetical protein
MHKRSPAREYFDEHFEDSRRELEEFVARQEREQVWVRITWRSALGRWSTKEM